MASSGFEPTHVRGQDPFADLSVESTLIDPKYALPADLRRLADKLAEEASPALPPGEFTRVKVRVNPFGGGQSTQIGEMIPADMDVLMTAHLPTSFDLDDIAGDELGDARDAKISKARKSVHNPLASRAAMFEPEVSDPIVRPVENFSDEDEPATVNAFIEHVLPGAARPPKAKPAAKVVHHTTPMRPIKEAKVASDMIDTIDADPNPTLPPKRTPSPRARAARSGFVSPSSIPRNEVTKTCFGGLPTPPEETNLEPSYADDDIEQQLLFDDEVPFGDIAPDPEDSSFGDVPGFGGGSAFAVRAARASQSESPAPKERRSFDQVLDRVRKPKHEIGPQRYIQTKITSNPRIGVTPEDTSIVKTDREETGDSTSGFADGKPSLGSAEMEALTKPPRTISPYIIVGLGVIGAIAALVHAIQAPL